MLTKKEKIKSLQAKYLKTSRSFRIKKKERLVKQ
jgi:hypothetical protein